MFTNDIDYYFKTVQFLYECRKLGLNDDQAWRIGILIQTKIEEAVREANKHAAWDEDLAKGVNHESANVDLR